MDSEWPTVRLGDVVELKRGYDLPKGQRHHGTIPIVSSSGVSGFHDESQAASPGVVTGRYGTIGRVFFVREPFWPLNTTLYVRNFKGNDPRFVSYLLQTVDFASCSDKGAVPGVNRNHLHELEVKLPPLDEQRAIAQILGSLDDKIELNYRISRVLDDMVQAVFKSWFLDFEGGAARDLATSLPPGWALRRVGDVLRVVGGTTPSTKIGGYWSTGGAAFCTPRDMSRLEAPVLLETERSLTDLGTSKSGSGLLPVGTVLMSSRAPIGYTALVSLPVAVNQGIIAMVCDGPVSRYYALCWVRSSLSAIVSRANGSTFLEISKGNFKDIEIIVPSAERLSGFDSIVEPMFSRMVLAQRNTRSARTVRDALVPRLLSGGLHVG